MWYPSRYILNSMSQIWSVYVLHMHVSEMVMADTLPFTAMAGIVSMRFVSGTSCRITMTFADLP